MPMSDKKEYDTAAYGASGDGGDISVESGDATNRSDEGTVKDPFEAPLKRKLKSRHLQMIAIGGSLDKLYSSNWLD